VIKDLVISEKTAYRTEFNMKLIDDYYYVGRVPGGNAPEYISMSEITVEQYYSIVNDIINYGSTR